MVESEATPRVLSGRYELSHLIARGGMAEVYLARDRMLDRPVALKILFPELSVDRSFVERFRREAQAAANLSHPNIVPVFDWGEDGGTYFIVMEFVDGRTLSAILRGSGPLHPDRAAEIAADVAGALSYAHRHAVVHRDMKPGNVLITEEGVVKVADFGIARALNTEESLTQTGAVMGTATYFSPEQAEGMGVDARSDIYSLGVVLFEMVTGRPPFLGDTPVAVASKHVREDPPTPREINPAVPPDLEAIILKCMAKSPEHRYPTGDDLRVDLMRYREGHAVSATIPAIRLGTTQAIGTMGGMGRTATVPRVGTAIPDDRDRPPSRTGIYAAVLVLLLAALAVVVIFLGQSLGWWHLGRSTPTVSTFNLPNVVGQNLTQAEATLQGDGLQTKTQEESSSSAATTQVIGMQPRSGTKVRKGQTITLQTGGKAPVKQLTVPTDLIGQSVTAAQVELAKDGIQSISQFSSTCTQENVVCSTNPAEGTTLSPNSVVSLFTAQPTTTTTTSSTTTTTTAANVPDVVSLSFGEAKSVLQGDGLTGVSNGTCLSNSNTVIAQNPSAGSPAPSSGEVSLTCSVSTTSTTTTTTAPGGGGGGGGGLGIGSNGSDNSTSSTSTTASQVPTRHS
ncbi:MAG TPA: Stk1 family PASTA domain-containing Ser/Thr kinase [Acidimicrobiales bacterium]|nr:Stk1 family PASTA domain-containing Ser/Thr kinase [Acidimicrobiales bacterium]